MASEIKILASDELCQFKIDTDKFMAKLFSCGRQRIIDIDLKLEVIRSISLCLEGQRIDEVTVHLRNLIRAFKQSSALPKPHTNTTSV